MGIMRTNPLLAALASAATVNAHGYVQQIVANGVAYQGYDVTTFPYTDSPPTVVGWAADNTDLGFVSPSSYSSGDIICHRGGANAKGHATVAAGDSISLQWSEWPESHHGPMLDYLASCNGDCETVDKTTLEFFRIDGSGIADSSVAAPGKWGSDVLIENNNTWLVQIPSSLKPGNYVLRHETIALHSAGQEDGAQNYPQCFNLKVTGSGSDLPAGTLGTKLYTPTDPGILMDIYSSPLSYEMPGPALVDIAAKSTVAQSSVAATATSSATVGSGSGNGGSSPTTTAEPEPTTTAADPEPTTTTAEPTTSAEPTTTAVPTTFSTATRPAPSTTVAAPPSTTSSADVSAQTLYGQCGGNNWTGATACGEGSCKAWNEWYHQCVSE